MRRRLWILLTVLLLVVGGDTLVWYYAVRQMRAGLADWIAGRRVAGWSVTTEPPQAGGWPVAATLTLRDVSVQGGADSLPGGFAWGAERVVLRISPRNPRKLQVDAAGAQHLRAGDGPDIPYTAGRLTLLVPLVADSSVQALHLSGEGMRARVKVAGADDTLTTARLDADTVFSPAASKGQPAVAISASADGIGLPPRMRWALGPRIASIVFDGALNGPLPVAAGPTAFAAAWRDAGGMLEVRHLVAHWGPLGLTATATLALDSALQPMGNATATVTGYAETLDALAHNGLMSRSAATTAKAVLSLLADTPANGGPPEVEVPLSLQKGTLSMRQVPLVRLPELDWPQP